MKVLRIAMIAAVVALLAIGVSTTSNAFHSGGVAECMGCHTMHGAVGPSLLLASDASSTCLSCHSGPTLSSYHVETYPEPAAGVPPVNFTPGGDFSWLKKDYYFAVRGSANTEMGHTHGHNIVAADKLYSADPVNTTAPGGTFTSANLACNSCHDQHGQGRILPGFTFGRTGAPIIGSGSYQNAVAPTTGGAAGVYRLLRGNETFGGVSFPAPPVAVTNNSYNRSEFYTQTRTAYGSGMSEFCAACHADMHSTTGILRHKAGGLNGTVSGTVMGNYNTYVKSGLVNGAAASAYLSLVPFEEGLTLSSASMTTLRGHALTNDSQLGGMTATSQVMCLSCHRAHASGFMEMTRWNNEGEFIVINGLYPGTNNAASSSARGKTQEETAAGYYNRDVTKFATYQRSLCNKCHAKD